MHKNPEMFATVSNQKLVTCRVEPAGDHIPDHMNQVHGLGTEVLGLAYPAHGCGV
jgi:hypothetical protein